MSRAFLAIAKILVAWTVFCPAPAFALNLPEPNTDETSLADPSIDGKRFVEQMHRNLDKFNDYTVDSAVFMYRPAAEQVGGGNICFKKINLFKLTVKSKGIKNGSLVIRTADGKIKAVGGPSLRFLKMTLNEDSRLLQIPNGFNAIKSDLGNLLNRLNDSISSGGKVRVTTQPVNVPRLKQSLYVMQILKAGPEGDTISEQLYVDQANSLPVEWDIFRNGKRFSVATFENFKGNIGLDERDFSF
jgi:outer membrane lipoprotein-sorting protein